MASQRYPPPPPPSPVSDRSCTDVLCLLLWLAFVLGWAAVAVFVYSQGDPDLLLHPTNSDGEPCGAPGTQVEDKPYLAYFDMTECSVAQAETVGCPTPQVCVAQCPTATYDFDTYDDCGQVLDKLICRPDIKPTKDKCKNMLDNKQCAKIVLKSVPMMDRCIPNILESDISENNKVKDHLGRETSLNVDDLRSGADGAGRFTRLQELGAGAFSDLQNSWWVIVVACVASALLSLLWTFLMRFITVILIWTAFIGLIGATIYGCVFTYLRYDQVKATSGDSTSFNPLDAFTQGFGSLLDQPEVWMAFFVILCVVAVLLLLLLLVLYKRIRVATAMLSQASRAVNSALSTLFFPLVPFALQLGVVALFLSVALYTASTGSPTYRVTMPGGCTCSSYLPNDECTPDTFEAACSDQACLGGCAFAGYEPHPAAVYIQIYNVFALFWGLFFCSALGELILAGAFAGWYWTFDKKHDLPSLPVLSSAGRAFRYHLGTVAFGSLIIAIIRMARATLEYIQRQTKGVDNPLARGIICCCKCCLWCFEKFMRFINRNAYILCAIYGTNFCASAKEAFSLLMRNILRVVVVNSVCEVMLLMGKLVITALVTIASFYFMEDRIPIEGLDRFVPTTQHSWVPITTVAVASFFICSVFFSVYTMAVDTIFLCFLEDIERNDGSPEKPFYMSKSLMSLLGKKNKRTSSRDLTE
ncbi:Choline transporter-like protein 2 [Amphibalanus amphitrite]|uniref:Choline transporter-like protein n=1 Tax=Amphibalanus amphitrite TaxID=1232801 RepID=A0A6A4V396_AMPAM|nr:Choline transporter-like protein 2 [Amphibalanus amphitrite]